MPQEYQHDKNPYLVIGNGNWNGFRHTQKSNVFFSSIFDVFLS